MNEPEGKKTTIRHYLQDFYGYYISQNSHDSHNSCYYVCLLIVQSHSTKCQGSKSRATFQSWSKKVWRAVEQLDASKQFEQTKLTMHASSATAVEFTTIEILVNEAKASFSSSKRLEELGRDDTFKTL
jgi:hypothetical protein